MSTESSTVTWRVSAQEDAPAEAFDALILPHVATPQTVCERHVGLPVPHEGTLSDEPHTLIVRARPGAGPLVVEYEVHGPDGALQMRGRSTSPLAVIVRSATSMLVTGLPDAPAESIAPAT